MCRLVSNLVPVLPAGVLPVCRLTNDEVEIMIPFGATRGVLGRFGVDFGRLWPVAGPTMARHGPPWLAIAGHGRPWPAMETKSETGTGTETRTGREPDPKSEPSMMACNCMFLVPLEAPKIEMAKNGILMVLGLPN